jgi:hypothetical protein
MKLEIYHIPNKIEILDLEPVNCFIENIVNHNIEFKFMDNRILDDGLYYTCIGIYYLIVDGLIYFDITDTISNPIKDEDKWYNFRRI